MYFVEIPRDAMPVVAQIGAEHEILEHAEFREKAPALGAMANAAADHIVGSQPFERQAIEHDAAGRWRYGAGDRLEQGRLAGAVWSQYANELAGADAQGYAVEGQGIA